LPLLINIGIGPGSCKEHGVERSKIITNEKKNGFDYFGDKIVGILNK
jgi:hypothetical protein